MNVVYQKHGLNFFIQNSILSTAHMHASQLVQLFNNFSLSNQSHTRMIVLFYALLAIGLSSNITCHSS